LDGISLSREYFAFLYVFSFIKIYFWKMDRADLLQMFTPSYLTAFQQKLFISILVRLPENSNSQKKIFQFKASSILSEVEEKLSYEMLQKEMLLLVQKTYVINTSNQLMQVSLISKASFLKGKGIIEIEINGSILPYLYQLKQVFHLNTLRYVLKLKSTHSINIYLLLEHTENNQKIFYSIDQLKMLLGVQKHYKDYSTFKSRVILQAQKELHLTNKAFIFKEKKEGKKVTQIIFEIYPFEHLYWTNHKKYLMQKIIKELNISQVQASKIVFQFVEEEIYSTIYLIKERERAGDIKTSLAAYSVGLFNQMSSESI
jgi:hypothetical protein